MLALGFSSLTLCFMCEAASCLCAPRPAPVPARRLSCAPSRSAEMLLSVKRWGAGGGWLLCASLSLTLPPKTSFHSLKCLDTMLCFHVFCKLLAVAYSCFQGVFFAKNVCWRLVKLLCWNFVTLTPKTVCLQIPGSMCDWSCEST